MKISFFVTSSSVGGAQVFCSVLLTTFLKGHECYLISGLSSSGSRAFSRTFSSSSYPPFLSHRIINSLKNNCSILDDICSLVKVFLYIIRHRDHVIITNSGKVSFFVRLSCLFSFKSCFLLYMVGAIPGGTSSQLGFFIFLLSYSLI